MLDSIRSPDLAGEIRTDIASDQIKLPTLPEVALKVREAVESADSDAGEIAALIGQDVALSARLLQVANSPLYRGRTEIDSIQQAVARLGLKTVRSLVVSLAMKQIFQATSDALDARFRAIWDDSLQVAAISRVLANNVATLENEQALLGGLIHNIGALPILTKLDEHYGFEARADEIDRLIAELGPEIGAHIMQAWGFSESLANIPLAAFDLNHDPGPEPTYADLVIVARLQNLSAHGGLDGTDWSNVPAFAKLGMEAEVCVIDVEGPAEEIAEVRNLLDG
jgi:HD-like signal output (HDOD) protein